MYKFAAWTNRSHTCTSKQHTLFSRRTIYGVDTEEWQLSETLHGNKQIVLTDQLPSHDTYFLGYLTGARAVLSGGRLAPSCLNCAHFIAFMDALSAIFVHESTWIQPAGWRRLRGGGRTSLDKVLTSRYTHGKTGLSSILLLGTAVPRRWHRIQRAPRRREHRIGCNDPPRLQHTAGTHRTTGGQPPVAQEQAGRCEKAT